MSRGRPELWTVGRGLRVTHVLGSRHAIEHVLTPWARLDGAHIRYAAPDDTPELI
jgi:hypothetical protein